MVGRMSKFLIRKEKPALPENEASGGPNLEISLFALLEDQKSELALISTAFPKNRHILTNRNKKKFFGIFWGYKGYRYSILGFRSTVCAADTKL